MKVLKKKARELNFISQIARDGSKVIPVNEKYQEAMMSCRRLNEDNATMYLMPLSLSQGTYIAHHMNVFVVTIKGGDK
jgi:Txe/YoeB family toxin of Txe-Axe toxin-antitoxin module